MSRRKLIATLSMALPALGALATGAVQMSTTLSAPSAVYKYDWPQFGMTPDKRANDTLETTLTPANVSQLTSLFTVPLNGDTPDGSPVELSNVTTPTGVRDLLFTQGEHGTVTAWDANTGALVWSHKFPAPNGGGSFNTVPAIDPNRQFIYAATNDSMVHKFQVGDGTEVTGGGWPEPDGGGKNGGSLSIATARDGNTYLYVPNHGHGHVTTINVATGSVHIFNASCVNQPETFTPTNCSAGANTWARDEGAYDADMDRVFFGTGTNDGCTCWITGVDYRNSIIELPANGAPGVNGQPVDTYSSTDVQALVSGDSDLGNGNVSLLPHGWSSKYPNLGIQGGKDHRIILLNLDNLSGQGGPGHLGGELQAVAVPELSMIRAAPAIWTNPADGGVWAFYPGNNGIIGIQVTLDAAGNPTINKRWEKVGGYNFTTSVDVANNMVFESDGGGEHGGTVPANMKALDPTTGNILWSAPIAAHHWSSPIVVNGTVYITDGMSGGFGSGTTGSLHAWRLPGGPHGSPPPNTPTPTPTACSGPTDAATGATGTALGGGQLAESWTPPTTGCGSGTYYAIYTYGSSGASSFMDESAGASFTKAGLNPGEYYVFTVTTWNGHAWSAWSGWSMWTLIS